MHLADCHPEKVACGQSQRQQKHHKYDVLLFCINIIGTMTPAAHLKRNEAKVHLTSPDFTSLHWNCIEFHQLNGYSMEIP